MRISVALALLCLSVASIAAGDPARAAISKSTDIPPEELGLALQALARDRDFQLVYRADLVAGHHTDGVHGDFTLGEALSRLLQGSGLTYHYLGDREVTIVPLGTGAAMTPILEPPTSRDSAPQVDAAPVAGQVSSSADSNPQHKEEGKKNSSHEFRLAQMGSGATTSPSAIALEQSQVRLEEIVVTAQKREERLQDVPVPVTALSAQALIDYHELRIQDYYTRVPGLNVTPGDYRGDPILTIRGITTGGGGLVNPTVGIVIDDVPFGSSTGLGGGGPAIDIDPTDLARIEVLRGPQGTLYGVSSIGGLLKYVTVDPSTESLTGHLQAGTSAVYHGAEAGYNASAAVNVPLGDAWAIRASGSVRRDPGYVDNIETGQRGINEGEVTAAHLSALWRPSGSLSLKLSALVQDIDNYGSPQVEPALGDLKQSLERGTGTYHKNTQAYSAILKAKLGNIDVTSLTGYSVNHFRDTVDDSYALGSFAIPLFGVNSWIFTDDARTDKFTQEFRLSSPIGQYFDGLLGLFYTHERTPYLETDYAENPQTGALAGYWLTSDYFPTTYEEYAVFADLKAHLTSSFDIQFGGRESQNRQTYMETLIGVADAAFFGGSSPVVNPLVDTKNDSFTYLVTPQYRLTPDFMVYARLASGYRAGGPNPTSTIFHLPPSFGPDTTRNYEVGAKGDFLEHTLSLDASVYYIDWRDIQLQLTAPVSGANYYANASRAKSQGIEFSFEASPIVGLRFAGWVAFNEATLTQGFPATSISAGGAYGVRGNPLPDSSRFSGNLAFDETVIATSQISAFVGAAVSYVGEREGVFTSSSERQFFPAYAKADVHMGFKDGPWTTTVFVDNVADRRGVLSGGLGTLYPIAFTYIQPRTAGVSVARQF